MKVPTTYLQVSVLVPADRVAEFQRALGALITGEATPGGTPGSSGSEWRKVSVPIRESSIPAFFSGFGAWLSEATSPAPSPELVEFTPEAMGSAYLELNRHERELLLLLSDDRGRPVGWPELKRKLLLSGKPSLTRDFPLLAKACEGPPRRKFPVHQDGNEDEAVFTLPSDLVTAVRYAAHTLRQRSEGETTRTSEKPSKGASS